MDSVIVEFVRVAAFSGCWYKDCEDKTLCVGFQMLRNPANLYDLIFNSDSTGIFYLELVQLYWISVRLRSYVWYYLCFGYDVYRFNTPQTCKVELEVLGHKLLLAQVCHITLIFISAMQISWTAFRPAQMCMNWVFGFCLNPSNFPESLNITIENFSLARVWVEQFDMFLVRRILFKTCRPSLISDFVPISFLPRSWCKILRSCRWIFSHHVLLEILSLNIKSFSLKLKLN